MSDYEAGEFNARLEAAGPAMFTALEIVQGAIADWRDGKNGTVVDGHELNLEEIKYVIVDPILEEIRGYE